MVHDWGIELPLSPDWMQLIIESMGVGLIIFKHEPLVSSLKIHETTSMVQLQIWLSTTYFVHFLIIEVFASMAILIASAISFVTYEFRTFLSVSVALDVIWKGRFWGSWSLFLQDSSSRVDESHGH